MQADDGGSVYLRLSTRTLDQPERAMTPELEANILAGAYWMIEPGDGAECALVYCGPLAPEVLEAHAVLAEDIPGLGVLAITSWDRLYHDWQASVGKPVNGSGGGRCHLDTMLSRLAPNAGLVTVQDGHPASLSWIGSASGRRVYPLGVSSFGQSGDLPDLYRTYRIDADAIIDMAATACIDAARAA